MNKIEENTYIPENINYIDPNKFYNIVGLSKIFGVCKQTAKNYLDKGLIKHEIKIIDKYSKYSVKGEYIIEFVKKNILQKGG